MADLRKIYDKYKIYQNLIVLQYWLTLLIFLCFDFLFVMKVFNFIKQ